MTEKNVPHAPNRKRGDGPFGKLVIQGATMIDGTGAPPNSLVDILIEENVIKEIIVGGMSEKPPEEAQIINANGMYVMPGFIDRHAHIGGIEQGVSAEYVYKPWMGHGVTTIRDPGSFNGVNWTLYEKDRSAKNEIVAPRIYAYSSIGNWDKGSVLTPQDARKFVLWAKEKGVDGFKIIDRWDTRYYRGCYQRSE